MAKDNRPKELPETLRDSLQQPAGANGLTLEQAREIAARVDRRQEMIDAAAEEQAFQAKVAAEFRHFGASDVLRLWETGRNEKGKRLSKFEVMALGEQWAALTGQLLPDLGNGTMPASQAPAAPTPAVPGPGPAGIDPVLLFREVIEYTKLSKTEIKRRVELGTFPPPIKRSIRRLVWKASVIRAWLDEQEAASLYRPGRGDRPRSDTLH